MTPPRKVTEKVSRREVLGLFGLAGAAAAAAACGSTSSNPAMNTPARTAGATATSATKAPATGTAATKAVSCVVSPTMTEGPFFVDEQLNRADIRSDPSNGSVKAGVPLRLAINLQQVSADGACTPLAGAHVDIWHCDAGGLYSDEQANNTVRQKFLRGYQLTDAGGNVEFTTVYPGWYAGRAVHIHVKARAEPTSQQGYQFTSQFFFDDALTDQVFAKAPYNTLGARDTRNANDNIFSGGGSQMVLKTGPEGDGYFGAINIGVKTA
jgi:protocatechuate 3,4-dioxygenase beta subunit